MRDCPVLHCLVLTCVGVTLLHAEGKPAVQAFPGRKIFPLFYADALAHQLSLSRVTDNRDWIGAIGGSLPVVQVDGHDMEVQLSVAATAFNRLIKTPGHITVFTVDYKIDFPVDLRVSSFAVRVGYGHMSSHFADDGIEQLGKTSISSVKDYFSFAVSYDIPFIAGFAYGGIVYNYHNEPILDKKWLLQTGVQVGEFAFARHASLYAALDIKVKQDVSWGSTQSYQVGIKMFSREAYGVRFSYTLRRGFEERGQLFNQKETMNLLSVFLDF